jgi:hypothetical protein
LLNCLDFSLLELLEAAALLSVLIDSILCSAFIGMTDLEA